MTAAGRSSQQRRDGGAGRVCRLLLLLFLVVTGFAVEAQPVPSPDDTAWFESTRREWDRILNQVEAYFASDAQTPEQDRDYRALLDLARSLAVAVRQSASERLEQVEALLAALGPPPAEGAPSETEDVARKREAFNRQIAIYRGQIAEADVALARIQAIEDRLLSQARQDLRDRLTERLPIPIDPEVILTATPEFGRLLVSLAARPVLWYSETKEKLSARLGYIPLVVAGAVAVFVLGWLVRRLILRRFGPDPAVEEPRYASRLLAAIARFFAVGIIPAILLGLLYLAVDRESTLITADFRSLFVAAIFAVAFFVIVHAVAWSVLSPDLPAWQLTNLVPRNARRIGRLVSLFAGIAAADAFVQLSFRDFTMSAALQSIYLTGLTAAEVSVLLVLTRDRLWQTVEAEEASQDAGDGAAPATMWRWIRLPMALAAIISLIACLAGYVPLGRFLMDGLVATALVFAGLAILREFIYDGLSLLIQAKRVRTYLRLSPRSEQAVTPWVRIILDPALFLLAIIALAPAWGAPIDVAKRWILGIADGITIGDVTLSPVDIIVAGLAFFATIALTRLVQRQLLERVLPYTTMPIGLQHSISGGLSYLGVIAAATIAIAVLGVDLTNIAIVLGALSVGIGFGLQNIVNNFVSGMILLIERPVNVGDWVVIGGLEGIVKRINIRATEIETWQMASIVVPNAEVLSNAITNLTLRDRYGRLEVDVIIPFGTDTRRVEELLMEVARARPEVVSYPAPFVVFRAYGAYGLEFRLHCFIANVMNRLIVTSEVLHAVDARLRAAGIPIPYPQSVVHYTGIAPGEQVQAHGEGVSSPTLREVRRDRP